MVLRVEWMEALPGMIGPYGGALLFVVSSVLMVWRLECMAARGLEGTVIGTVVMPYASGAGNLFFVYTMLRRGGDGGEVLINCVVNNATNLTLFLGLPALFWGLRLAARGRPKKREERDWKLNRLSVYLTLAAGVFFTAVLWVLGLNGTLGLAEGLVLVGVFLFWQGFQVFDVLKTNIVANRSLSPWLFVDGIAVVLCGFVVFGSVDIVVDALMEREAGFVSRENLGWLTGWLMVLPNAVLALYYASRRQGHVVYTSQVGDGHICIPLCIGLFACFQPVEVPQWAGPALLLVAAASGVHVLCLLLFRGLPRWLAAGFIAAYGYFLYLGWV